MHRHHIRVLYLLLPKRFLKKCTPWRETGVKELPQGEFCNMCTALADHCLVKLGNANNDRLRKLRLLATEDDVVFSLQGVHFFRNLLGSSK
jgi:cell division control protein 6